MSSARIQLSIQVAQLADETTQKKKQSKQSRHIKHKDGNSNVPNIELNS